MVFSDYMNHKCNIYHLIEISPQSGYGITAADTRAATEEPDIKEQPCHFHITTYSNLKTTQNEPYSSVDGEIKLSLPPGTDIRMNDIVEDCETGLRYRADAPREIHNGHHIIAMLRREDGIKGAI